MNIKGPGEVGAYVGKGLRIGIVHARWNTTIIDALLSGCLTSLTASGVDKADITVESVPGAFEVPFLVDKFCLERCFDAVIGIGVLIKGSTMHFEYIADAVSHALMKTQLTSKVPVIFGVLTLLTEEQGLERAGIDKAGKGHNHGEDWGFAAVEMACKNKKNYA